MKTQIISVCLVACFCTAVSMQSLYSQQNVTLNFIGKSTATGTVQILDSIQVKGLTKSFDTTLKATQQLILRLITGIDIPDMSVPKSVVVSNIFGNPFSDKTWFYVTTTEATSISLSVFNVLGKTIISKVSPVEAGVHRFRFEGSALDNGIYFLAVRAGQHESLTKMLKNGRAGNSNLQMIYEGRASGETGSSDFFRKSGSAADDYRLVGFAKGFIPDTLVLKVQKDTTVEFQLNPALKSFNVAGAVSGFGVALSGITISDGARSATTGNDGRYSITDVPNGTWTVTPTKVGYKFNPVSRSVVVNNSDVANVDFSTSRVSSISGTLTGSAVSGITVSDGTRSAITGSDGRYVISDVPNGTYAVTPSKAGCKFNPVSRVAIVNNADVVNVDFAVTTGFAITGTITGSGIDASGITVSDGTRSAVTGSDGRYSISNVPNGSYTITPTKAGYKFNPASRAAVVNNLDVVSIDFTASSGFAITGTIAGSGSDVSGVTVSDGTRSAITGGDGKYSISDVPNGTYTITPTKAGRSFSPASRQAVVNNANATNVDFSIVMLSSISGTITGSGLDVSGITVSDGTRSGVTDNSGQYSIANVPNGSYTITPTKSGLSFTPASKSANVADANVTGMDFVASDANAVTDIDGNIYHTVTIGTQVWMVENLKTTRYNDGTAIPLVTDNTAWGGLTTPGYCWYNNDAATYKNPSGALYNWYAVNTGKLAPVGWHVPTDAEWATLITYLGGATVAGGKMKEAGTSHWNSPNTGADNSSGFTAVSTGSRYSSGFTSFGLVSSWWSSTSYSDSQAYPCGVGTNYASANRVQYFKSSGFAVRCLKN